MSYMPKEVNILPMVIFNKIPFYMNTTISMENSRTEDFICIDKTFAVIANQYRVVLIFSITARQP